MNSRKTTNFIFLFLSLLILSANPLSVCAVPKTIDKNFIRLSDLQGGNLDFYISRNDLDHDLVKGDFDLSIYFDGRSLLRDKLYPQNIKVEIYTMENGEKKFVSILNRTVKSNKAAKNVLLITSLPRVNESIELYFDVFDSHNMLHASYSQEVSLTATGDASIESLESIPEYTCLEGDGECLIEYLLRQVSFSASYDRNLKTEVTKNEQGKYTVSIPVKKGRRLKKKVKKVGSGSNSGKTNGKLNGQLKNPYPYYENETEVAITTWDQIRDAINFEFNDSNNNFSFKKDGSLQLSTQRNDGFINISPGTSTKAPIVLSQGSLLTEPVDGAIEFDGNNLYITSGSTRTVLGAQGPVGPPGAPGPAGPAGSGGSGSGIDLSNGGYLNGTINFITGGLIENAVFNGSFQYRNGANNGLVLTSDANGNATWQPVMVLVNSTVLSTGPLGSVQFAGVSNGFDYDYNNFFWDDGNNRLGLGTNTPEDGLDLVLPSHGGMKIESQTGWPSLDLRANTNGSDFRSLITSSAATGTLQFRVGEGPGSVSSSSNAHLRITSNGNVGIGHIGNFGLSDPAAKLTIDNTDGSSASKTVVEILGDKNQIANLTEWQDANGTVLSSINNNGSLTIADGTQADGFVLTSDINGLASWQNPTTLIGPMVSSSGVAGAVQFSDGANGFSSDANNFFWDGSNGRLGIGLTNPSRIFDVANTMSARRPETNFERNHIELTRGNPGSDTRVGVINTGREGASGEYTMYFSNLSNGRMYQIQDLAIFEDGKVGINFPRMSAYPPRPKASLDIRTFDANANILSVHNSNLDELFRVSEDRTLVNGNLQIRDGSQANDYVLTSDTNGNASWQDPSSLISAAPGSSGIAGAIQFSDGANGFSSDASNLFWDGSNGRLGIGLTNPGRFLDVASVANFRRTATNWERGHMFLMRGSPGSDVQVGAFSTGRNNSAGEYTFYMTNTSNGRGYQEQDFSIYQDGRVAISFDNINLTPRPKAVLDIRNNTDNGNADVLIVHNDEMDELFKISNGGQLTINDGTQADGFILTSDANGIASWQAAPSGVGVNGTASGIAGAVQFSDGAGGFDSSASNFFWDDSNGRLGIGDNTPRYDLDIRSAGTLRTNSIRLSQDSGNSTVRIYGEDYGSRRLTFHAGEYVFGRYNVPIMNLSAAGNLGINDTTPDAKLDIHIDTPAEEGLTITGANGQTANLSEWQDFNGTSLVSISPHGQLTIADGTQADGFVLTSDANGNASWQAAPTGADNLGNHTANQGLVMAGFSITAIGQANGNTANFNNGNFTTVNSADININNNGFFANTSKLQINGALFIPNGAANGFVLASDANGFATWISAAALSGTGDNLGNHNALQRIDMGGFSLRNADQVNGVTANFTNGNFITVNNTNSNTTGFALFNGSSSVQFNGSFAYKNGASNGYVMMTDANGNAFWQDPVVFLPAPVTSSGPAGAVQFSDGANGFSADSANLFWNDTSNRLGIGNSTLLKATLDVDYPYSYPASFTNKVDHVTINPSRGLYYSASTFQFISQNYNNRGSTSGDNARAAIDNVGNFVIGSGTTDADSKLFITRAGNNGNNQRNIRLDNTIARNDTMLEFNLMPHASENGSDSSFISAQNNGNTVFRVDGRGDVAIGFADPQTKLDINGSILIRDGTQANGYVLTSDANGVASWQDVNSLINGGAASSGIAGAVQFSDGAGGFDSNGNNFYWDTSNGRLGIGVNTPNAKQEIRISSAEEKGFILESAAVQNANLLEFKNSLGTNRIFMDPDFQINTSLDPNIGDYILTGSRVGLEATDSIWLNTPTVMLPQYTNFNAPLGARFIVGNNTFSVNPNSGNLTVDNSDTTLEDMRLWFTNSSGLSGNATNRELNTFRLLSKTLTSTTSGTINSNQAAFEVYPQTYTHATTPTTFSEAATMRIHGKPVAGANATITELYTAYLTGNTLLDAENGNDLIFTVRAHATQNENLSEWQNSNGDALVSISKNGSLMIKDGTQANGYILTSDANGVASWQDPSTLISGGSEWTDTGTLVHPAETTDDVAIGGTNSSAPIFFDASNGSASFTAQSDTSIPVSIFANVIQTNNLLETYNNGGSLRALITAEGEFSNNGGNTGAEIFGNNASTTANHTTTLGFSSQTSANRSIAIGYASNSSAIDSVVIGSGSSSAFPDSVAIGDSTLIRQRESIAIGKNAKASHAATAIGNNSNGTGTASVSLGWISQAHSNRGIAIGSQANVSSAHTSSIAIGAGATTTAANQLVIGSQNYTINNLYFGQGATSNAPTYVTLNATGGSGTNINGANLILAGGTPTGTGTGGDLIFQTANGGAAGIVTRDLHERMRITQDGFTIINGSTLRYIDGNQANGYVLTSNADGNASWQDPSSLLSASEWTDTGTLVHPAEATDDVAIGGTNSSAPIFFDASNGSATFTAQAATDRPMTIHGANGQTANLSEWHDFNGTQLGVVDKSGHIGVGTTDPTVELQLGRIASSQPDSKMIITGYDGSEIEFNNHNNWSRHRIVSRVNNGLEVHADGTNSSRLRFSLRDDPLFHIYGAANSRGILMSPGNITTGVYMVNDSNYGGLDIRAAYAVSNFTKVNLSGNANKASFGTTVNQGALHFKTEGTDRLFLDVNGSLGLGFSQPITKLDINGSLAMRDGTQADGFVLTSDVNGVASWQAAPIGVGVNGTASGPNGAIQLSDGANGFTSNGTDFVWSDTNRRLEIVGGIELTGTSNPAHNVVIGTDTGQNLTIDGSIKFTGGNSIYSSVSNAIYHSLNAYDHQFSVLTQHNPGGTLNKYNFATNGAWGPTLTGRQVNLINTEQEINSTANGTLIGFNTILTDNSAAQENIVIGIKTDVSAGTNASSNRYAALLIGGNVGVDTLSPEAKLDINGDIAIRDGTEADGYVLSSDVNGNASWQDIDSLLSGTATASGVAGAVQFSDGANGFDSDASNFFWDDINGSLAIATTNTNNYRLRVNGEAYINDIRVRSSGRITRVTDAGHYLQFTGDGSTTLRRPNNFDNFIAFNVEAGASKVVEFYENKSIFFSNNSEKMRLDHGGNLGLNDASPSSQISIVNDDGTEQGLVVYGENGQTANLSEWVDYNGTAMTVIDSAGKVGIGTSNPQVALHVKTSEEGAELLRLEADGRNVIRMYGEAPGTNHQFGKLTFTGTTNIGGFRGIAGVIEANTAQDIYQANDAVLVFDATASSSVVNNANLYTWNENDTSHMVMAANGNLGINVAVPARKLHINDVMRLEPRSSAPAGAATGDIYIDSDGTQAACVYLNGAWVVMAGSGTCS